MRLIIIVIIPFMVFGQTPCLDSSANIPQGIGEFVHRSNLKYKNLYGYEKVEYVNTNTNVIIIMIKV